EQRDARRLVGRDDHIELRQGGQRPDEAISERDPVKKPHAGPGRERRLVGSTLSDLSTPVKVEVPQAYVHGVLILAFLIARAESPCLPAVAVRRAASAEPSGQNSPSGTAVAARTTGSVSAHRPQCSSRAAPAAQPATKPTTQGQVTPARCRAGVTWP